MAKISRPKRRRKLLLVDDSPIEAGEYKQSLEVFSTNTLEIELCNSVDNLKDLVTPDKEWDFVLLDMMMPPGHLDIQQSGAGKYTGYLVAQEVRRVYPEVPIILLSNAPFEDVVEACRKTELNISNCLYWQKQQMGPRQLAKLLDEYFEEGRIEKKSNKTLLQKIFGMLLLQPNFAGVGIDLKAGFEEKEDTE